VAAVDLLDVQPDDLILEIGCGRGVAAELICRRLRSGRLLALDRSAKAIVAATVRNAEAVAAGTATFAVGALEDADVATPGRYDKILAVNVNLFWVRPAHRELRLIAGLLRPDGRLWLCYDPPGAHQLARMEAALTDRLKRAGYHCTASTGATGRSTLLTVTGTPVVTGT